MRLVRAEQSITLCSDLIRGSQSNTGSEIIKKFKMVDRSLKNIIFT